MSDGPRSMQLGGQGIGSIRRAAAALLTVSFGLALLAPAASAQDASAAPAGGTVDPMKCAGATVNIALVAGERDELGLLDKEAEIEAATGVDLVVSTEQLADLVASNNQNLEAP